MAENSLSITPLNGSNFPTWKIQCRMTLMKNGLWNIVNKTETFPERNATEEMIKTFKERRDHALATIVLSIEPSLLYLLGDPEDPVAVWNTLCDQYQQRSWTNKVILRRKLYEMKLKEGEPVRKYIHSVTQIFDQLEILGDVITEESRVLHILASLPNKHYSSVICTLENNPIIPKLNVVINCLLHQEKNMKEPMLDDSVGEWDSFAEKERYSNANTPVRRLENLNKTSGSISHFTSSTPNHLYALKNAPSEHDAALSSPLKDESYSLDVDEIVDNCADAPIIISKSLSMSTNRSDMKKWIVDSTATAHMCNDFKQFVHVMELKESKRIKIDDECIVEAKGRGLVKIRVKAAGKIQKCKLRNVLFVPDLTFNVISVANVEASGKRVVFDRFGCQFVDITSDETVATAEKIGNLYYVNCVEKEEKTTSLKMLWGDKEVTKANKAVQRDVFHLKVMTAEETPEGKSNAVPLETDTATENDFLNLQCNEIINKSNDDIQRRDLSEGDEIKVVKQAKNAISPTKMEGDLVLLKPNNHVQHELSSDLVLWPEISPTSSDNSLPRVLIHHATCSKSSSESVSKDSKDTGRVKFRRRRFGKLRRMFRQDF